VEGTAGTTWPPWRWLDFSSSSPSLTNHSFKKAGNKCRDCRGLLVNMQYIIYIYNTFII
jgi:hypothetical protein